MKIPSQKKIVKSEFDEESQELVEQLGIIIDYNFERVFNALNKNLSLGDNLSSFVKDLDITVDSNGLPITPVKVKSDLIPARPAGTLILSARNLTNTTTYPSGAPFISFSEFNGLVSIEHVTGLQANNKYKLTVVFFA